LRSPWGVAECSGHARLEDRVERRALGQHDEHKISCVDCKSRALEQICTKGRNVREHEAVDTRPSQTVKERTERRVVRRCHEQAGC
jgi:hypothetical protein